MRAGDRQRAALAEDGVRQFVSDRNVKQHIRYRIDAHRAIGLPCEIGVIEGEKCQCDDSNRQNSG